MGSHASRAYGNPYRESMECHERSPYMNVNATYAERGPNAGPTDPDLANDDYP